MDATTFIWLQISVSLRVSCKTFWMMCLLSNTTPEAQHLKPPWWQRTQRYRSSKVAAGGSLEHRDNRGWETWWFPRKMHCRECPENLSLVSGWTSPLPSSLCPMGSGPSPALPPQGLVHRGGHPQPGGTGGARWPRHPAGGHGWPQQPERSQAARRSWRHTQPLRAALSRCRFANSPVECS